MHILFLGLTLIVLILAVFATGFCLGCRFAVWKIFSEDPDSFAKVEEQGDIP